MIRLNRYKIQIKKTKLFHTKVYELIQFENKRLNHYKLKFGD